MSLSARIAAYDREQAAARSASAPASLAAPSVAAPPSAATTDDDDEPMSPFADSAASSASAASSRAPPPPPPRPALPNEHLAVLIPRDLWKPDRLASHCDKYACRVRFSLFERKHHCRKCGGVFCHHCSARTTPLLDTARLPFLLPPKGTPITAYAGPTAPIHRARVCDDCFEQLQGYPTPRPRRAPSPAPPPPPARPLALAHSYSSLSSLELATPPDAPPPPNPHLPRPVRTTKLAGDLDRYPLKDPSATCKAAGGGRWAPTPIPPRWDARLPDGRFRLEAEAERRAAAHRRRLANPVIVDGPIRVRRPPRPPRIGPPPSPTF